jgi:hypothetical protein
VRWNQAQLLNVVVELVVVVAHVFGSDLILPDCHAAQSVLVIALNRLPDPVAKQRHDDTNGLHLHERPMFAEIGLHLSSQTLQRCDRQQAEQRNQG